jgi:4-hydroxy-3-methylbut-2-enyl diphosphate reductase
MEKRVVLANPRGFCAGVDRAITTVETLLKTSHTTPAVYVRRQIVHNRHVVERLGEWGAVFVDELEDIPDSAVEAQIPVVFSAHGVSPQVRHVAEQRGLNIIDATCPLVNKVHREVVRFIRDGYEVIYIGHAGHDEAIGVIGEYPQKIHLVTDVADVAGLDIDAAAMAKLVYVMQTTLSVDETKNIVDALRVRFPSIEQPPTSDICYATQNRQDAVKKLAAQADCVLVVGSPNSSNTVRLAEVAQSALNLRGERGERGTAHRIDDISEIDPSWLVGVSAVGVTSGASVPEELVQKVVEGLARYGFDEVVALEGIEENMHFGLPARLRHPAVNPL